MSQEPRFPRVKAPPTKRNRSVDGSGLLDHPSVKSNKGLYLKARLGLIEIRDQAPVVQRMDNAIQRINRYPVDKCW